jgi:hypothetical protein
MPEQSASQEALNAGQKLISRLQELSTKKSSTVSDCCQQEYDQLVSSLLRAVMFEATTTANLGPWTKDLIRASYMLAYFEA